MFYHNVISYTDTQIYNKYNLIDSLVIMLNIICKKPDIAVQKYYFINKTSVDF